MFETPMKASLSAIVIVFVLSVILLAVAKPKMVLKDDKEDELDKGKIAAYSVLFALIVGLVVFGVKKSRKGIANSPYVYSSHAKKSDFSACGCY